MKSIVFIVLLLPIITACKSPASQAKLTYESEHPNPISESERLLRGAKTLYITNMVYDVDGCRVGQTVENALQTFKSRIPGNLKLVTDIAPPDLYGTLDIEIASKKDNVGSPMCLFEFNLRIIHPMMGQIRYKDTPTFIQAWVFNKSLYGVTTPEMLSDTVTLQAGKLFQIFLDTYNRANPLVDGQ